MKRDLAIRPLDMAVALRRPPEGCIHHTARGSQYCSNAYQRRLSKHGFKVSMSGKGRFSNPVLCLMILSVEFNIVVSLFDGSVRTTIKTDNHHLLQEIRRPLSSLLRRGRCQITSRLIQLMVTNFKPAQTNFITSQNVMRVTF